MYNYIDILGYTPTVCYFFAQVVPALAIGCSFGWLCVLLTCPLHLHSVCFCWFVLRKQNKLSGTTGYSKLILCFPASFLE